MVGKYAMSRGVDTRTKAKTRYVWSFVPDMYWQLK
jgi:hypothetical protein